MKDPDAPRPQDDGRVPLDAARMWENICLADELTEDCLSMEAGLAANAEREMSALEP